ncbi:MAG: HAD family hydrolase [Deltaproteobacteria bacterium]|nr:HAD family hydrolase [Deltaproteobacteria bacterium]
MNTAAFFDLDGTLLDGNSGWLWMTSEWRQRRITAKQMFDGTVYVIAYKLGMLDMEQAMAKALETIRGNREESLRTRTHAWFHEQVAHRFSPPGLDAVEWHRAQGHKLVLLTSASLYESEAVASLLKLDHYLCTRYELKDGRFTGHYVLPQCFGAGKVVWARAYAQKNDIDLAQSYFYSDSITDLPMLETVGHPMVVNPDLRLRLLGHRRHWPIHSWSMAPNRS